MRVLGWFCFFAVVTILTNTAEQPALAEEVIQTTQDRIHEINRHIPGYNSGGPSLKTTMLASRNKTLVIFGAAPAQGVWSSDLAKGGDYWFTQQVCQTDAIVIGSVSSMKPLLSADESTVFTDYDLDISAVLKNSTSAPISVGTPLTITQAGGRLHTDGGTIEMKGDFFPPALYPEKEYMLLFTLIPSSETFMVKSGVSTYVNDNGRPRAVTPAFRKDLINDFLFSLPWSSLPSQVTRLLQACSVTQ